jgi:hypothetical protein
MQRHVSNAHARPARACSNHTSVGIGAFLTTMPHSSASSMSRCSNAIDQHNLAHSVQHRACDTPSVMQQHTVYGAISALPNVSTSDGKMRNNGRSSNAASDMASNSKYNNSRDRAARTVGVSLWLHIHNSAKTCLRNDGGRDMCMRQFHVTVQWRRRYGYCGDTTDRSCWVGATWINRGSRECVST